MIPEQLHALTHQIPGVPEHDPSRNVRSRRLNPACGHQGRTNQIQRHASEPRVLVRWQRWIASLAPRRGTRG